MNEIDENTAENDEFDMPEKKEESLTIFEMIKSLGAYILNYLIVVYFLAISEEEPSYILSFMGVIFAFLLFLKVNLIMYINYLLFFKLK